MNDWIAGIDVFVEAAEAGSFSAAAERLALTRSAVAKTIARLEKRLGTRLFHRTTRKQVLTEQGQLFYASCRRAIEEIKAGQAQLESGRKEVSGRLRVSVPVLFGRICVAPVLLEMARVHPGLQLDISFSDRVVDLAADGFDLAIRTGSLGDSGDLIARRLVRQRMTLCASPDYLARHGAPSSLDELERHDAVVYARPSRRVRSWLFPQPSGDVREIEPRSRLRFDDLEAIVNAAIAGHGIAWLPCWLIHEGVRSGRLVRVLDQQPGMLFDSHAVWLREVGTSPRIRAAVDALLNSLPEVMQ